MIHVHVEKKHTLLIAIRNENQLVRRMLFDLLNVLVDGSTKRTRFLIRILLRKIHRQFARSEKLLNISEITAASTTISEKLVDLLKSKCHVIHLLSLGI